MIDWSNCSAVERDPNRVSGAWLLKGTRVPVSALFENLEDNVALSQFLVWFPGVELEQAKLARIFHEVASKWPDFVVTARESSNWLE